MSYKVLARRWRPHDFSSVVGQDAVLTALSNALDSQKIHHAYLFTGTRGVGKTSLARILAKSLNCAAGISSKPCGQCDSCRNIDDSASPDVIEIDAASRTKVEDTRELLENIPYAPIASRFKIYIIDEVHMLSQHSFNALLKTIEEPPEHVKFILATTDPQKIPLTIVSRCLQLRLKNFTLDETCKQLAMILTAEDVSFEDSALLKIATAAKGSLRDALTILEQVLSYSASSVTKASTESVLGLDVDDLLISILKALRDSDGHALIRISTKMRSLSVNFQTVLHELQSMLHKLSVINVVPNSYENCTELHELSQDISKTKLQIYYQATVHAIRDLPYVYDESEGFEMALLRMLAFFPVPSSDLQNATSSIKPQASLGVTKTPTASVSCEPNISDKKLSSLEAESKIAPIPPQKVENIQPKSANISNSNAKVPNWTSILANLNLSGLTKIVAENCNLVKWSNESVELLLAEEQKPLLNERHQQKIQAALEAYLGGKVHLTINCGALQTESPAEHKIRHREEKIQNIHQGVHSDPLIKELQETFDATIEEVTIVE